MSISLASRTEQRRSVSGPLLEVRDLRTHFFIEGQTVYSVDGVSFHLDQGEVLGLVGESGCGKSVTALSLMRLIEEPGRIVGGEVLLHQDGTVRDVLTVSTSALQQLRGNEISMIFQDPMTSLNPVLSVGYQLAEPLRAHRRLSRQAAEKEAVRLLARVGIPDAERRAQSFPHQFSGGMRQRVMIAMAMACRPRLIIADEPTTALDVTIQAQILDLLRELRDEIGTSIIIITHHLGVVAELADRVAVMYAGHIVETGSVKEIFARSRHPYTRALLASIPRLDAWPDRLATIEGAPPNLRRPAAGCPFAPRCPLRIADCTTAMPPLLEITPGHHSACLVAQRGGLEHG
ncbi:MAG: ABC transporter ATP-binding protein [Chloroflexota bacterium]